MKKSLLFLSFFAISLLVTAQALHSDKLKRDLNNSKRQDTIRVNLLNELATITSFSSNEREKYAKEAIYISDKINYPKGKGNALMLLASVKLNEGKPNESKLLFHQADSIANKTGNLELQANISWRRTQLITDPKLQTALFMKADSLAKKSGNIELQATVLFRTALPMKDIKQKMALMLKADSLAKKAGNLELQISILVIMSNATSDKKEQSALMEKAISVAKSGSFELQIQTLKQAANFMIFADVKKAIFYYLQAEKLAKESGNKVVLASVQSLIGNYYLSNLTNYTKAMEYFLAELKSAEEANDTLSLINSWSDLGTTYSYMGDQDNALIYLLKAETASKKLGNKLIEAGLQTSIGERYRLMGKYPEAIIAYNKSTELSQSATIILVNESNLADVYTRMGNLPLAFQYAFSSLKKVKESNYSSVYGWVYGVLSRAYLKKNMIDSALYYGRLGLSASKESSTIEFMRDNSLALSNAYAAKKDFANAYSNYLMYVNYRDSMMNEEVRNKTAVQQYTFNLDKKEAQITTLGNQKKYQRNLLTGAMVLLFLILASAILLLRNNRLKQKANKLLEKQKQEIDDKANNVEMLSDVGRKITSSLSIEKIIGTVYDNVNTLMDANVFGIGIYNEAFKRIEFPGTYENGEPLPFYSNDIDNENRFGSVCFKEGKEIIINNIDDEFKDHIQQVETPDEGGQPVSIIFLPLISKAGKLGVLTVQSFQKNAYSDYQLFMLRNIATYTTIAIENAEAYDELNNALSTLRTTQTQLIQSEKMASLGELTAGIAHEIQNPLNFVNNFSDVNKELIAEMREEISKGNYNEVNEIAKNIEENAGKINHHGKRADAIVKGMLQHSRSSSGVKEPTDINALADEYLRLCYHGLRAKDKSFNATLKTDFDAEIGKINIVPQEIGRVIMNLVTNAFYAVSEKVKTEHAVETEHALSPGTAKEYEPMVSISTKKTADKVEIKVTDNGNGIPHDIVDKIFQPFFTTKPTGQGTGLGLSLSYDIVKAHGGELSVETNVGEGTQFILQLSK